MFKEKSTNPDVWTTLANREVMSRTIDSTSPLRGDINAFVDALSAKVSGELVLVKHDPDGDLEKKAVEAWKGKNYKDAEEAAKDLLSLREKTYGKDSREVALTLNILGGIYADDGKFAKAKGYYERGARVSKVCFETEDNVMTALFTANTALMDAYLGNLDKGKAGFKEAVRIYDKNGEAAIARLGDKGIKHVAGVYSAYALILEASGDKAEALKQREKAAKILRLIKEL